MKLFDILKSRWPEAIMVAGLQACCMLLVLDFQYTRRQPLSFELSFLLGIIMALFGIISQMLLWGFLRTVAIGGAQPVEPKELLRTGRGYFWKMFIFQLVLLPVFMAIIFAVVTGVQMVLYGQTKEDIPAWLSIVSGSAAGLILLKPTYLVPAQILTRDCGIWEAVRDLRQTRLFGTKYFPVMAVGLMVFSGVIDYLSEHIEYQSLLHYPVLGTQAAVTASGMLVLFLAAVLEVDRTTPPKADDPDENKTG